MTASGSIQVTAKGSDSDVLEATTVAIAASIAASKNFSSSDVDGAAVLKLSLASGVPKDVDFFSATGDFRLKGPDGEEMPLEYVKLLVVKSNSAAGTVEIDGAGANGWTNMCSGSLFLKPMGIIVISTGDDPDGVLAAAANKVLNFDPGAAVHEVEILALGTKV